MTKAIRLTDTHLVLLSAAGQHPERLLDLDAKLKESARKAVGEKLLGAGLVEERVADLDHPIWRTDEEGARFALRITASGLAAIGIEEAGPEGEVSVGSTEAPSPAFRH